MKNGRLLGELAAGGFGIHRSGLKLGYIIGEVTAPVNNDESL